MNAAHALGVGSCWIHRAHEEFDSDEGKALLAKWGVEGEWRGVGHCILGYADEGSEKPAAERLAGPRHLRAVVPRARVGQTAPPPTSRKARSHGSGPFYWGEWDGARGDSLTPSPSVTACISGRVAAYLRV